MGIREPRQEFTGVSEAALGRTPLFFSMEWHSWEAHCSHPTGAQRSVIAGICYAPNFSLVLAFTRGPGFFWLLLSQC